MMGSIYQRGTIYWIKYYSHGRMIRESSKSEKITVAKKLLAIREADIAQGRLPQIHFERITFDDLSADYVRDAEINRRKSLPHIKIRVEHLKGFFEGMSVPLIDGAMVRKYIEYRLAQEPTPAPSTVNKDLEVLRRMLNLGKEAGKVDRMPAIKNLKAANARQGFFEHEEFLELRTALPEYLKGFATFAYRSGWRKSEIAGLKWSQVDRSSGTVRLNPGETKNDEARTLYLDIELRNVIAAQWRRRSKEDGVISYVFLNDKRTGPIVDFRKAWKAACKTAEIGDKLFHDFRRTAVRNMVRAGVPEVVAMAITGHKTRSIFARYNIVSGADLQAAMQRQTAYLEEKSAAIGTKAGTITEFPQERRKATSV